MQPNETISNSDYHANTARIGKSGLDLIHKSPAHYYAQYLDPERERKEQTPAMRMGTLVHCAILEPEEFSKRYVFMDDTAKVAELCTGGAKNARNTNEYRAWVAEFHEQNVGKEVITPAEYKQCIAMRNAVWANESMASLLTDGVSEKTVYFTEPSTGVDCKSRPDRWNAVRNIIIDVKTTDNASAYAFGRSSFQYGYHRQGAFYIDSILHAGLASEAPLFVLLAVEKEPPYASALYYLTDEQITLGRESYLRDLEVYKACLQSGVWPGYPEVVVPLQLPAYAYKSEE